MFFGEHSYTMDAKGRVSIPAPFRDRLLEDPRIVLAPFTVYGNPGLAACPSSEWQKLLEKVQGRSQFNPAIVRFELGYLGRSHWCDIDTGGPVLVPPSLRKHADLKKDVVFVGGNLR